MAPGVAARVAGWQRRLGGQAGPLGPVSAGPSGDSPSGSVLQVEIPIDGVWTDVTSRVMTRDGSGGIAITRGRPNESSATNPSTCALQLNNRDGLFSPRNPLSPFYGKAGRNTQIRVSVPSGSVKSYRFWGEFSELPQQWDTTGTDVWVDLQASGVLRRLGQGNNPIGSDMRTALEAGPIAALSGFTQNVDPIVAYWPCEDGATATSISSALSSTPGMTISGTPTLSSFNQFACSDPLPVMGTGTFTAAVPIYTPGPNVFIRFLMAIPAAGATDGQVVCAFTMAGLSAVQWECYYSAANGGLLGLRAFDAVGTSLLSIGAPNGGPVNGEPVSVAIALLQDGPDIDVWISTVGLIPNTGGNDFGTLSSSTVGVVTSLTIAPSGGLTTTAIGHVRIQSPTYDSANFTPIDVPDSLIAHVGENADLRVFRILSMLGIHAHLIGPFEETVTMGAQLSSSLLSLVSDCVTADGGILYETLDALGLGYRTRVSLENQAPALALSYSAGNLADALRPTDDDQYTRNDITVSRTNGASARATLTAGSLSVLPPPAGVGPYPDSVTVNIDLDSDLADQAGWRLHMGTVDEARHPTITVNLAHPTFVANPALRQQALAVGPGDRITISNPPPWLPPDLISQIVVGFSETIDQFQHRITFNCVPESPYHTAVLEDPLLGRLDTGGSQLAADALATDTTLLVATTSGPLWTTAPADWPFDIRIAGEQMTVTAVSGSTSPQPFTVTRSVNGVIKPQLLGADVRLNQPMILAL